MLKIIKVKDYDEMSRRGADIIFSLVCLKPECVLGLATGSTPVGMYKLLSQYCGEGRLDFSKAKSVNLDEYVGLSPEHDQSYRYFMNTNLFDHINIDKKNTYVPDGLAENIEEECKRYDALIQSLGGVEVQVLGLGHDGHIAFNEPETYFPEGTHEVKLTDMTIDANQRFFASRDEVPRKALTQGIGTILQAKKLLMLVSGEDKAEALAKVLEGPVTPEVPGSAVRLHRDVVVIADEAALSKCHLAE